LTGFWRYGGFNSEEALATAEAMAGQITHRGPDDTGVWTDVDIGLMLAHRRLSILDLSPAGHQPMVSASGRYVIVFNGEIYNHLDLRQELDVASPLWGGHSDTETLLAGFEAWGIEATIKKSIGMFAIVLWDRAERALTLARDRMGEKPLYYGWNGKSFLFASELKALRAYRNFNANINRNALTLLLRHNYIPAPYSIYHGIFKLLPGTILTLRQGATIACPWGFDTPPFGPFQGQGVSLRPYWALRDVVEHGQAKPFTGTENEAVEELERVLTDAIRSQQISDVPLGAFLSGGVDSSTIVALMQSHSSRPVRTFTIGFQEEGYNEAEHAKAVARHLGTEHTELYVTPHEAMAVIPRLPAIYDEPFSDSSQIPTFLVSEMTRKHVTVSLSGDAGDELFGGYDRYFLMNRLARKIGWLPRGSRRALARGITTISPSGWDSLYSQLGPMLPNRMRMKNVGDKAHKLAQVLEADNLEAIYQRLVSHWKSPTDIVINASEPPTSLTDQRRRTSRSDFIHHIMYLDAISYLPDDILAKVDRDAMAVSLETRVPFLDHRVVEFAWRLPLSMKIRNGQGKWILRQVLYKYVQAELINRSKKGFGVPIDSWLRGPLRDWAESLLNEGRLRREGFLHSGPIIRKWHEHISGARNWHYYLWDVLMFQAWLEYWNSCGHLQSISPLTP
jgi:asparagine synthase (glutamine-hydrolysing)